MSATAPQLQKDINAIATEVLELELLSLPKQGAFSCAVQRFFEISLALVAIILSAPAILAVGLIIWRGTPGPVLFRQMRLGKDARPFRFTKFRTLYADARQRWPELYAYNYTDREIENFTFKIKHDPRVTPQGVWLRKSTLDELPNFWNVLTGEMALVGPRPEIPEMLRYYKGEGLLKFKVRPGVTGLAQVSGRGGLSFKETVRLDVEYVKTRSLWLDVKILAKTAIRIITREGAF